MTVSFIDKLFIDSNEFLLILQKPLSFDSCLSMLLEFDDNDELSMLEARSDDDGDDVLCVAASPLTTKYVALKQFLLDVVGVVVVVVVVVALLA